MANDNPKDKHHVPTLKSDQIIRSDTQHVVSFNERTGKAESSVGAVRKGEARDKDIQKDRLLEKPADPGENRQFADKKDSNPGERQVITARGAERANIQRGRPDGASDNIVDVGTEGDITDETVAGSSRIAIKDHRLNSPDGAAIRDTKVAKIPDEIASMGDNATGPESALTVNFVNAEGHASQASSEPSLRREALRDNRAATHLDEARPDASIRNTPDRFDDSQAATQLTSSRTPPRQPGGATRPVEGNFQRFEPDSRPGESLSELTARSPLMDNIQFSFAELEHHGERESQDFAPGSAETHVEQNPNGIENAEFAKAVAAATASAMARMDPNALLKLSLDGATVARLSEEVNQTQEIDRKLAALEKRLELRKPRPR
jgi:hypothetical protein